ncbi:hypothetical protein COY91_02555 [Candidatus Shapirobacteria bacterium CG_4_10_14_0_8_um_filter_39_15]|nr:MAG: hypothetical protein COY91_02555 [Candidatus Shapirobacteria bacterium CG_4_10_14_0_8_um_filter_39_15]
MYRLLKILFLLVFFFAFLISPAKADENLTSDYQVTAEAKTDRTMHFTYNISLKNNTSEIYASSYSMILDRMNPANIKAFDSVGPLDAVVTNQNSQAKITVNFSRPVVGKDKILSFTLNYDAVDSIKKSGQAWEVMIPKLSDSAQINNYHLVLKIPSSFGKPAYLSLDPFSKMEINGFQIYEFNKNQLSQFGILGAFGNFQIFNFTLIYHLSNPLKSNISTQIALPPDTAYQIMTFQSLEPKPINVEQDNDGNWLATYFLNKGQKLDVIAKGRVQIISQPNLDFQMNEPFVDKQEYLKPQKYWEVDDQQIINLAQQLKTPEKIYDYVVKTLKYDYGKLEVKRERMGARAVLNNPDQAICTEFSDLFIALARAAGIPARELTGYSYTDNPQNKPLSLNQDILHAWPEYWDESLNIWKQVDPTWENTTGVIDFFHNMDLNHFVFAIHGLDSEKPLPAGAYKTSNQNTRDIDITFGKYLEGPNLDLEFIFNLPKKVYSEFKTNGSIQIENTGGEAVYNKDFLIETDQFTLLSLNQKHLNVIPPYGTISLPIAFKSQKLIWEGVGSINGKINNQSYEYKIRVSSFIVLFTKAILLIAAVFLFVVFLLKIYIKFSKSDTINP